MNIDFCCLKQKARELLEKNVIQEMFRNEGKHKDAARAEGAILQSCKGRNKAQSAYVQESPETAA